jgi:hypothetical protein
MARPHHHHHPQSRPLPCHRVKPAACSPARRGRARRLAAVSDRGKMRCPCHERRRNCVRFGGARRQGRVWRCLCPLHGGHSLLRAMAVKFNLTMAAYDLIRLPKLLSSTRINNAIDTRQAGHHKPPGLNHITRRWHEFSAAYCQIDESTPIVE